MSSSVSGGPHGSLASAGMQCLCVPVCVCQCTCIPTLLSQPGEGAVVSSPPGGLR